MDRLYNYEIRIEGHLSDRWAGWFGDLAVSYDPGGDTILTGAFEDQAALYGALARIQGLNLILISVYRQPVTAREEQ